MNDTMVIAWGGYTVRLYVSDPPENSWNAPKWRYTILDANKQEHPGRLTGASIGQAVANAVEDIEARESRLALEAKAATEAELIEA